MQDATARVITGDLPIVGEADSQVFGHGDQGLRPTCHAAGDQLGDRQAIAETLMPSKAAAVAVRPQLVAEAALRTGLAEGVIQGFLGRFNYDFTPAHVTGLELLDQILMRPGQKA